ncbi:MAG: PPK2 family polyphosphate kinase [Pseudomonadota bacterium]
MFEAKHSLHRVPYDGSFRVADTPTATEEDSPKTFKKRLRKATKKLDEMQRVLMARDRHSVLLVFQAMDAAGKDSTIRAVMQGINPAGCQVFSFKKPSGRELDHDFLWRTSYRMPERGRIGIFNRSQYEEVLVVRVHPEYLNYQQMPEGLISDSIWEERLESIAEQEKHLARNGTIILKFWLNVSKEEQKRRFLARLDDPEKNWKFNADDVTERGHWDSYMAAYEAALNATSRPWAPWYAIPADSKPYMRAVVAETVVAALAQYNLTYPVVGPEDQAEFQAAREVLENESD